MATKILNIVAEGDRVAVEFMLSGTFRGSPIKWDERTTLQPTGRRHEARMAGLYRVNSKGLITEACEYYDTAKLCRELGLK